MNFQLPASNISRQWHPCPRCNTSTGVNVISGITSHEDLSRFCAHHLNRSQCLACGTQVEAPVRIAVKLDCDGLPHHECVPLALLENPDVLDDILHNTPPGLLRVYSCDELERSIESCLRSEMRRRNLTPEQVEAGLWT